jgi:outer membrane protein insertion porin family
MSSNMNISSVRVEGANVTRSSFLGFLINPHLAANGTPSNLESVLHTTRKIANSLQRTDMFHSVEAKIERARDVLANEGDVDIVYKTREKGRFYLNTSTELGNGEGNAVSFGYSHLGIY